MTQLIDFVDLLVVAETWDNPLCKVTRFFWNENGIPSSAAGVS